MVALGGLEDDYILACTSDEIWKAKDIYLDRRVAMSVTDMPKPYGMAVIQGALSKVRREEDCRFMEQTSSKYRARPCRYAVLMPRVLPVIWVEKAAQRMLAFVLPELPISGTGLMNPSEVVTTTRPKARNNVAAQAGVISITGVRVTTKSPASSVQEPLIANLALSSSLRARSAVNFTEISVSMPSPASKSKPTDRCMRTVRTRSLSGTGPHLDLTLGVVPTCDVLECFEVEVGTQLVVHYR